MSIDISQLKPSPDTVVAGTNNVTVNWQAFADNPADNDVSLQLFVDPLGPIYILDNGNRVKSFVWSQTFPINKVSPLSKALVIEGVPAGVPLPVSCSLRLEATSKQGYKTACNSHIILK